MELMINALLDAAAQVLAALAVALVGMAGAWLTAKLSRYQSLKTIQTAVAEAEDAAAVTVLELQQTVVEGLKAASADGKLTRQEIEDLNRRLLEKTLAKLSAPAVKVLTAAGVDLAALITGAAEAAVARMKGN